jgi:hypothetical protein
VLKTVRSDAFACLHEARLPKPCAAGRRFGEGRELEVRIKKKKYRMWGFGFENLEIY